MASEDVFLEAVEAGAAEVLCFWESSEPFVVVGFGQSVNREVNVEACRTAGIRILRRQSGGGAVVQGPGCLSYALILRQETAPELATVSGSNRWIMERNQRALQSVLPAEVRACVRGHTDLALLRPDGEERKVSGNAQRRRRSAVLFHGTLLYSLESLGGNARLDLLRRPSLEPEYRKGRSHLEFLSQIPASSLALQNAWMKEWAAQTIAPAPNPASIQAVIESRYRLDSWNLRRE